MLPLLTSARRVRLAGAVALVAICIPLVVVLVRGEELLRHPEPIFWSIWVPALLVFLSLMLALGLKAVFLAAMALLAVVVVELGFGLALDRRQVPRVLSVRVAGEGIETRDSVASFGPRPGGFATVRRSVNGEVEYEVSVHIDAHGRRVTPFPHEGSPEQAALFFGGSWVFGNGLDDGDTLAATFSRLNPRYRSYNYAFQRWGPPQVLDIVRGKDLRAEISEDVGVIFYPLTSPDLGRAMGTMRMTAGYCRRCSNYEIDASGAVVRRGDLSTGRPWRAVLYALLDESNVLEYLRIDLPREISSEDRRQAVAVTLAIRDELAEMFPAADFFLVLLPQAPLDALSASLYEAADLRVLDYRELYDAYEPAMQVSATDTHPSALANERIARRLVADLASQPE